MQMASRAFASSKTLFRQSEPEAESMIYSISAFNATKYYDNATLFVRNQAIFALGGTVVMILVSKFDYHWYILKFGTKKIQLSILTVSYMKSLLENRGGIPKDMVFVGIGNTPWSMESAIYPFTSVDLHPEKLAQAIVQQAKLPPEKREDIFIEPSLLERYVKIPAKTK